MGKGNYRYGHAKLEDFFWFINERHSIWCRRDAGEPSPWTKDVILQTYKFTNVFRELDRGTLVLRQTLAKHDLTPKDIIFICFWYRITGKWENLIKLGPVTTPQALAEGLASMSKKSEKIFTSAYMTTGKQGLPKWKTTVATMEEVYEELDNLLDVAQQGSLELLFQDILECRFWGIKHFLAYEIVSDLRHYPEVMGEVEDADSWANIGPGCKRGLERLGLPVDIDSLRKLLHISERYLGDHVLNAVVPFEMREIEHSLCEFDKYQRTLTGVGRPKQRFLPKKASQWIRP